MESAGGGSRTFRMPPGVQQKIDLNKLLAELPWLPAYDRRDVLIVDDVRRPN